MKRRSRVCHLCLLCILGMAGSLTIGVRDSQGKESDEGGGIERIMKKAFKSSKTKPSLFKKATTGDASPAELKALLGYLKDLQKTKAPMGDAKDWDQRTADMVSATEAAIKGDKDAADNLMSAGACKECHKLHKKDD